MNQDVIEVRCLQCGKTFKVPAGKRRYMARTGKPVVDFCTRTCSFRFVADRGTKAQAEQWNSSRSTSQ